MSEHQSDALVFTVYMRFQTEPPSLTEEDFYFEKKLTSGIKSYGEATYELRLSRGDILYSKWKTVHEGTEWGTQGMIDSDFGYFFQDCLDESKLSDALEVQRRELIPNAYAIRDFLMDLGGYVSTSVDGSASGPDKTQTVIFQVCFVSKNPEDEHALCELIDHLGYTQRVSVKDIKDQAIDCLKSVPASPRELIEIHAFTVEHSYASDPEKDDYYYFLGFPDPKRRNQFINFGPDENEPIQQWIDRVVVPEGRLRAAADLLKRHGKFSPLFLSHVQSKGIVGKSELSPVVEWIIPGLLPTRTLALMAGERKIGKSALMLQLCVALANGSDWLGFKLPERQGFIVYVAGEDGTLNTRRRIKAMLGNDSIPERLIIVEPQNFEELKRLLDEMRDGGAQVDLIVIDPVMKFLDGNEKESSVVSAFYKPLERVIAATGTSVIVVHHVLKNAHPDTINKVASDVRGSSVISDRPRVILALARSKAGVTTFGTPVSHGTPQHNGMPGEFNESPINLVRDTNPTMLHFRVDEENGKSSEAGLDQGELDAILNAVERINADGGKVTRTGPHGLFEQAPPEIEGMPRAKVRALISNLVNDGVLFIENGIIVTEEGLAA